MLRHLGLIAICACIVASFGCDGGRLTAPGPPPPVADPNTTVTVEFGGRVVNAEREAPWMACGIGRRGGRWRQARPAGWVFPKDTATSGGDGTFTLTLNLPSFWTFVGLKFTGPAGYDDRDGRFEPTAAPCQFAPCWAAADRPAIRMCPALVIRPGESIEVRVESTISRCAFAGIFACRRVLVEAPPGEPVELEIVPPDTSKPMGLAPDEWDEESLVRLMVAPGSSAYVVWDGADTTRQGRLTARR
jgi:hypothetical protein